MTKNNIVPPRYDRTPDILIDMTSIEDKFFLLYNQAQSGINRNPILNFDTKTENLAHDKNYTKFLKMIIGVSKYTDNSSVFSEHGAIPSRLNVWLGVLNTGITLL